MQRTTAQSSVVADAIAIIAVGTASRPLVELAIALRMVDADDRWLPPGEQYAEMRDRIARNIASLQWRVEARAALRDPDVAELAWYFNQTFVNRIPTNSPDPFADEAWLLGVRAFYKQEPRLQIIANTLLEQIGIPGASYEEAPLKNAAPQPAATVYCAPAPAPIAAQVITDAPPPVPPPTPALPPPVVVAAPAVSTPLPEASQTKLIARLELLAKAKRFVDQFMRHWEAQKARLAAAQTANAPTGDAAAMLEPVSNPAHAPTPVAAPIPTPVAMRTRAHDRSRGFRAPATRALRTRTLLRGVRNGFTSDLLRVANSTRARLRERSCATIRDDLFDVRLQEAYSRPLPRGQGPPELVQ